ncbi:zinc finger MYND domain-containing protein 10 [Trichonephila clavata]|uniref:Zinc finger MYND domain-containing protein 10 n=1 Tax=Trichonephila clavata TaxID=2740835 RepID=A0A8X6HRL7_TRICU|nr:zinc finger MYND domain-containing protein 10 [Trichonephila clavata]
MKMDANEQVLLPQEIEAYLESLQPITIPDIGSPKWLTQRERIHSLSLQASLDVKSDREEIVKEYLVTLQKVPLLIHELIATEIWRLKVFPLLLKMENSSKSTIPLYLVLYQEAALESFLEAVLFHEEVVESSGDSLIDLVDYCYRNAIIFMSFQDEDFSKKSDEINNDLDEKLRLEQQKREIAFESGMKCISLLSYMTQHLKTIPLGVLHRLLVVHDVPLLFTNLLYDPPWIKEINGGKKKYTDGKWNKITSSDVMKISKTEGQIWIALIQLLLNPDCQKKYDMSGYKKEQLLKLRSKLNDVIIEQIPVLRELLRFLEHLSLFDAPVPKRGVIIEQVPEIWECLHKEYKGKWKEIATTQLKAHFSLSMDELQTLCKKLTTSFDLQNIEAMLPDIPLCAQCGSKGLKRCSRCKNEWYCGRPCQVSHWSKHQSACNLMVN